MPLTTDVVLVLTFIVLTSYTYYALYEIEQKTELDKITIAKEFFCIAMSITVHSYVFLYEYFRNRSNAQKINTNFQLLLKLRARLEEHISNTEAKNAQQQQQQQQQRSEAQPIGGQQQYFEQEQIFELQIEDNIV